VSTKTEGRVGDTPLLALVDVVRCLVICGRSIDCISYIAVHVILVINILYEMERLVEATVTCFTTQAANICGCDRVIALCTTLRQMTKSVYIFTDF
jgi:hypothetical protein